MGLHPVSRYKIRREGPAQRAAEPMAVNITGGGPVRLSSPQPRRNAGWTAVCGVPADS
ncbi:hypothetical protein PSP6_430064 [Paraburkholderia tropica]|nr:hypothetical protein PSP6_430064 [Paraburkholderia tropica]